MIRAIRLLVLLLALLVAFLYFAPQDPGCCSGLMRDLAGR